MKQKLIMFVLTSVLFCVVVVISLYVVISNYEFEERTKKQLLINNNIISGILSLTDYKLNKNFLVDPNTISSDEYRITLVDPKGAVVFDSLANETTMENHNDRAEIVEARQKGTGSSIRYSHTIGKNMIYVATKLNNDYVIRSSVTIEVVNLFNVKYLKYYIIALFIVLSMTAVIASRLSYLITQPIKDLEYVTSRISKGDLVRRVSVKSKDEIGQLGDTFNYMADQLQITLNDSIEKQNKLEAILKSMESGVIAVDRNDRIIMINPYCKKIFGIEKDIIGKNLMDYIRDFELEKILHEESDKYREIKIIWPCEKILRIRTADIVNANEHIGKVAVVHDITEIKKLENMRTEFVANVSHELKTPLTSIKGFAETLRFVNDEEKKEKFLDIINDEADRLTRLINDILTLSDLETHREERKEIVDINEAVVQVVNLIKPTADSKNIDISTELREMDNIIGSFDRFKQMLINLVDNAVKYSETGAKVKISTEMNNNNCVVKVKDTGVGIPKEQIPRLFERFYRVDKARSRANGGTGLGLAIVKHIVLSYKGTIQVKSEIGAGSEFVISIPVERS